MRPNVRSVSLGGSTNLALMAAVRPGFVPGFETITYVERLRRLLNALHASRQNSREGELHPPVFPDTIGRFGVIRSFRYAIWPRVEAGQPEPASYYLTLNVGFDGGWEPYMRVIYRDIGPLLDALLCHCPGYPGARLSTFDAYCRWVREHELAEGLYYTDDDSTAGDARYLAKLERAQREAPNALEADRRVATCAVPPLKVQIGEAFQAVLRDFKGTLALPLRTLKGLYRLAPYFAPANGDDLVLKRFAQLALKESTALFAAFEARRTPALTPALMPLMAEYMEVLKPLLGPAPGGGAGPADAVLKAAAVALQPFEDELRWLLMPPPAAPAVKERLGFNPAVLQDPMLNRDDPVTHGCVVMLQVKPDRAAQAARTLADLEPRCGPVADAKQTRYQVAFTHAGLKAIGIGPQALDRFPQEFIEGMEARCSILGDVRGNHPNQWQRPAMVGTSEPGRRIEMSVVHAVALLRCIDRKTPSDTLHPKLQQEALALADGVGTGTGLTLLAIEPMRSRRPKVGRPVREHFGFADGLSQPGVAPPPPAPRASDDVSPGELLLGFSNDRGDKPWPEEPDVLLDHGSFLVMRKLRQRLDHLDEALDKVSPRRKATLMAKMMGRKLDGTPLLHPKDRAQGNAFSYGHDQEGAHCPLQAHVRRANPRDGRPYMPRILRRGMSYGPDREEARSLSAPADVERGLIFMAYCASIAEQFETLQRWMAGGNSSGLSSAQADPFLAVPEPGEQRTFRYVTTQGTVVRQPLGDKPFVQLQWGLYLFVPSLPALKALPGLRQAAVPVVAAPKAAPAAPASALEEWRLSLEDQDRSPAIWAWVRAQAGQQAYAKGYGRLIGSLQGVKEVLRDFDARSYSVHGYAGRMTMTMGLNYLGQDRGDGYDEQARVLNPIVTEVREVDAYKVAREKALQVLASFPDVPPRQGDSPELSERRPIDLVRFSELVLADLCTHWFGLPEAADPPPPAARLMERGGRAEGMLDNLPPTRCPAHTYGASRTIFAPHPREEVVHRGQVQGPMVLDAVRQLFAQGRPLGPLTQAIHDKLHAELTGKSEPERQDLVERNVSGMLLGFPPTVHGNFVRTMKTWIDGGTLWEQQQALADALRDLPAAADGTARFARVKSGLRKRLMDTMRQCPIPEMLWRSEVEGGKPVPEADQIDSDRRVVLGIRSAMTYESAPDEMMFGGSCDPKSDWHTAHGCPGYEMGVGVLLGLLDVLLDAGTLRPTGSPVLLMLNPKT